MEVDHSNNRDLSLGDAKEELAQLYSGGKLTILCPMFHHWTQLRYSGSNNLCEFPDRITTIELPILGQVIVIVGVTMRTISLQSR